MRVTIITIGSRGDVQPYVALGLGLQDAGHEVRLATYPRFESFVRGCGLDFAPLAEGNISRRAEKPEGRRWAEKDRTRTWLNRLHLPGAGGLATFSLLVWVAILKDAKSVAHQRLADGRDACEGTDAIVVSGFGTLLGYQLAEKLRVPLIRAYYAPLGSDLAQAPHASFGSKRLARDFGRARSSLARQAVWQFGRPWVNEARRDVLALPPLPVREFYGRLDEQRVPLLYGYSPAVVPQADLGDWVHVTGYWFLDRLKDWQPPAALRDFLAAGPPPVFVGFGSMAERDPEATIAVVIEALARTGQRGIIPEALLPEQGVDLPADVLAIDPVPFDWLFPNLAAAVHHGGAGTTAQALRAGLPSVISPSFGDQPFWARRVHELGAGPPPIPRGRLSADRLAQAIRLATTDPHMRERAATLAARIQSEDGVTRAVEVIERHVFAAGRRRAAEIDSG